MALKTRPRPDSSVSSSGSNSRAKKLRKSISGVFRWRSTAKAPLATIETNTTQGDVEGELDRAAEIERARARLEGRTHDMDTSTSSRPSTMILASRRNTTDSVSSGTETISYRSSRNRHSPLDVVFEDIDVESSDGLPNYSSAAYPRVPATYTFAQSSPFALVLMSDDAPSQPRYHISVSLNVWMPTSFTTAIREGGSDHGKPIAQLEMGISARTASVTMGRKTAPLNTVLHKKNMTSHSRIYHIGDGREIKWKLSASSWEAYLGPALLASFIPASTLVLQPAAHPIFDHIIVGITILMRQHLTPHAAKSGELSGLFNYVEQARYAHTYDNNDY